MQKTKTIAFLPGELRPVCSRLFQQRECSVNIGLNEIFRTPDRPVDMAFRCEVNNRIRPVLAQELPDQLAIRDIAVRERVVWIVAYRLQVAQISCVGKLIEIDDRNRRVLHLMQDKVGPDETGAASDENSMLHARSERRA